MTTYRTVEVDGVEVFYREAGPADAPTRFLQDYGAPIIRLALIVQNAVAHEDGLGPLWETRRPAQPC